MQALAQSSTRRDFEGDRRRVDFVIGTIDQCHLHVENREARDHARGHDRVEAFFDARDEFLRHGAADDLGLELVARTLFIRLDLEDHAGELAGTTGLLLMRVIHFRRAGDRLAIGNLRRADGHFDLVGALQDVDLDVEMKLAHALDDRLARL